MTKSSRKPLFSFAVITDSHINQDEYECNSPFEVNKLANGRLRHIINDLNQRELTAVFHLGDVVHPVPSMGELYPESAARFFEQVQRLRHPLHIIPGNHDVGDKKIDWGPAGTVREDFLDAWSTHFGKHYFHVSYQDIEFLGINAQLVGSGLEMEDEQKTWLEATLYKLQGKRVFLLSHYPPFLENTDEREHYDNLSLEGRRWLLELIEKYHVEGLFAGHVHHFWYNRYEGCDCYLLPATSFVRQDYSEMFRIGPAKELGRNDASKLGYFLVHVYDDGHDFEMVRSYGQECHEDSVPPQKPDRILTVNPRTNNTAVLGFDLRQDWMERVQIPPSGGLDEFDRKWVRNDYGLLALWEMGIKKLRIPLQDITVTERRERIEALRHLGFTFTCYQFGGETGDGFEDLMQYRELFSSVEIVWPFGKMDQLNPQSLAPLKNSDITLRISPLRSKQDILQSGTKYYHVINHGLTLADLDAGNFPVLSQDLADMVDGWVFRSSINDDMVNLTQGIQRLDETQHTSSVVHLRMAPDNPAEEITDSGFAERRLAEAMFCTWTSNGPHFFCDALADNDRGYFPRPGVLNRLYNPKTAFHVVQNLHGLFNHQQLSEYRQTDGNSLLQRIAGGLRHKAENSTLYLKLDNTFVYPEDASNVWDLVTGENLSTSNLASDSPALIICSD